MASKSDSDRPFEPDWVSPPGETIVDMLAVEEMATETFSRLMGFTPTQTEDLLQGRLPIDQDVAEKLHRHIGGSVPFWLKREEQYRADQKRLGENDGIRTRNDGI